MRANRRRDTKPELELRSALHARGLRYRKDMRLTDVSGSPRPDIVFTRARLAVFVDGCFWHSCPDHGRAPGSNTAYWTPKLARNVERDRGNDAQLLAAGWKVLRIWEHTPTVDAVSMVIDALAEPGAH